MSVDAYTARASMQGYHDKHCHLIHLNGYHSWYLIESNAINLNYFAIFLTVDVVIRFKFYDNDFNYNICDLIELSCLDLAWEYWMIILSFWSLSHISTIINLFLCMPFNLNDSNFQSIYFCCRLNWIFFSVFLLARITLSFFALLDAFFSLSV